LKSGFLFTLKELIEFAILRVDERNIEPMLEAPAPGTGRTSLRRNQFVDILESSGLAHEFG
jgi:hypothetical protein